MKGKIPVYRDCRKVKRQKWFSTLESAAMSCVACVHNSTIIKRELDSNMGGTAVIPSQIKGAFFIAREEKIC